jgi:DNA adenine methylase
MGGGAFSFNREIPALVSDIRENNMDVYKAVKDEVQFKLLLKKVEDFKLVTDIKELEKEFYYWRDDKYQNCNALWEKAMRWIVIRQLCFSGMDRVNLKTGKFNVPFGWYKKFSTSLSLDHHKLLQEWDLQVCSFEVSIAAATENDFIFIDPPYLERNSDYGDNTHSIELHEKLFKSLDNTPAKWLLIHMRHPFYEEHYKDYNILTKDFQYASQWKGREQKDRKVEHLYITNCAPNNTLF